MKIWLESIFRSKIKCSKLTFFDLQTFELVLELELVLGLDLAFLDDVDLVLEGCHLEE